MTKGRVWATSENDDIEYVSLTNDHLEDMIDLLKKYYFPYENLCIAVGFAQRPDIIEKLDDYIIHIAKDGVSVVAIDKKTGKLAGALLNEMQEKNSTSNELVQAFLEKMQVPELNSIVETLNKINQNSDVFNTYNVDCALELLFLVVPPAYGNRGIGLKLFEVSLELATLLYKGVNVKIPLDDTPLPLEPRPKIATALFTTFKTQKIGRKLKFDIVKSFSYENMYHEGKSLAGAIGNETKGCTKEAKRLEQM